MELPFRISILLAAGCPEERAGRIGNSRMIVRKLMLGALMLGLGAAFTFGLAVALQRHATVDGPSIQPDAPPGVAADKRREQEWMF